MPWNGSGVFTRIYSWVSDAAAGINITASRTDTDTDDITSNGLGNCLTRDGQGQPTANLPMSGFRHTGAANAVGAQDYTTLAQLTTTSAALALVGLTLRRYKAPAAKAADYTVVAGDIDTLFKVTATANLTLPDNATVGQGWACRVKNFSTIASPASVAVLRAGADVIDADSATTVYVLPGEAVEFEADGAGIWYTRGRTSKGRVINEKTFTDTGSTSTSLSLANIQNSAFSYQPVCVASDLEIVTTFYGNQTATGNNPTSTFQQYETTSGNVAVGGSFVIGLGNVASASTSGAGAFQNSLSNAALTARAFRLFAKTSDAAIPVQAASIVTTIREVLNA